MADDVLKALLENELLTEDVKKSIADAFTSIVNEQKIKAEEEAVKSAAEALKQALTEARESLEVEVRTELATKFLSEREELIKSFDDKITEMLKSEINELKEDIEAFRNLEVEYTAKLEDEKQKLAEQFAEEKKIFITTIDEFVEARLSEEIKELREDINVIKENTFGRKVFETFVHVFKDSFVNEDEEFVSIKKQMEVLEGEKAAADKRVQELQEKLSTQGRSIALESTLAPLTGKRRAVMESILNSFPTEKFGEVYRKMLPRVMDTVKTEVVTESKTDVVTEPVTTTVVEVVAESIKADVVSEDVTIKTGDSQLDETVIVEEPKEAKSFDTIRRLAGIR